MKVLIVGGGGREHALAWALHREDPAVQLTAAPGNPGLAGLGSLLPIPADAVDRLAEAASAGKFDLTIIGPEVPLALGLADRLRARGRPVFGPSAAAAALEASKAFSKDLMAAAGIPTAGSRTFTELAPALAYVDAHAEPLVVKASGLAAGKGAIVCATRREAAAAVRAMLGEGRFGDAGRTVVVEAFLEGEELSVLGLTNGEEITLLPASQDHKRLGEGDTGPNTGGMGAYAPVTLATPALLERVRREVMLPALAELGRRGAPFLGCLYAGIMVSPGGAPSVVEFNCRFGDPETQVVLPLLKGGLTEALHRVARGEPAGPLEAGPDASVTTVLAARGYPDAPEKGAAIAIPERLPPGVTAFHAGTTRDADGVLRVAGGRVINVTAVAPTLVEAQARSRAGAEAIEFAGKTWRRDIG
ncbi:MAG TPA: phosphoribosylamine--glycine ligase, partial [Gemmatimonadales bacterium]|nr:phosphoribosylamine--glycine ligase [Gemmatimonadales bacterium]